MNISQKGIDLIKSSEGCRLTSYPDPASHDGHPWTIAYGSTRDLNGVAIQPNITITQAQADELLLNQLIIFEHGVNNLVKQPLKQQQYDALVDFCWNEGLGNFAGSHLLKLININPNDPLIGPEFEKWVMASGKVWKGLQVRRAKERAMYFS